jgi:uncharacterized protein YndB with AHSA1/START domain
MTESTITISRTVAASPDRVFAAWTDVAELARWWWPQLADTTYDVDAQPGGRFRIHSAAIGVTVTGVYSVVDRPRRLVFSWNWRDEEPGAVVEDTVVVTFEPEDAATVVTVAHTSTAHVPEGGAERGWNDVMDRLVRLCGVDRDPATPRQSSRARS